MNSKYSLTALLAFALGTGFLVNQTGLAQTPPPQPSATPTASPVPGTDNGGNTGHHWRKHGHHLEKLSKALDLTDAQKTQVKSIFEQNKPLLKQARQQGSQQFNTARQNMMTQVRAVLTPDQQQKFDQLRQKWAEHHFDRKAEHHVVKLTEKLNLTADQQTKVREAIETAKPQFEALRQNTSLSKEDKHTQAQAIRTTIAQNIRAVLNPDQQKQFDTLVAEHQARKQNRSNN